jgi:CheY-like chemotaxis protein
VKGGGSEAMNDRLKILAVDDEENARVMLKQLIGMMGHEAVLARNGLEAVALFESEAPDIVLMDVMMPELDGFKATARIRQLDPEKWVPVVFLSALHQTGSVMKGLDAGGDDYIVKPVNLSELQAKIRAMQRVIVLQRRLAEERKRLEAHLYRAEEDARLGSHIMDRLTSKAGLRDPALQYWSRPLQRFNGDLVAAARTPGNVLHVMLADAVGHGLPAALNALPLADTFYGMTAGGFPLKRIIGEMNRKIRELLPRDRFVTATLASFDPYKRELQIWNGGNPAPLFVDAGGRVGEIGSANQLPLGLLGEGGAEFQPETIVCREPGQLVMFTDGMCEARGIDGSYWGSAGIRQVLSGASHAERFDRVLAGFESHLGGQALQDDASLMVLDVSLQAPKQVYDPAPAADADAGWKLQLEFGAQELRKLDVVPILTMIVEKLEASDGHRRQLFTILSELFSNALEHGLLQLDSRMKSGCEGFEAYMRERAVRLGALRHGWIEVRLERSSVEGKPAILIGVKDSGPGFDYRAIDFEQGANHTVPYGRGILVAKTLSHELRYHGAGNAVTSCYLLGEVS